MSEKKRWLLVAVFAAAMAWMESATVVYLRTLVGRVEPYQADPWPVWVSLGETELVREAATLVMLLTVGGLAGRTWRSRLAYSLIAFGIWDILYYAFLAAIVGWPRSILDWDLLFLVPLPWWGPVIAPVLIAAMMIVGGTLVSQFDRPDRPIWPGRWALVLNLSGVALALYTFVADAVRVIPGGVEAIRAVLPKEFTWSLFIAALMLMVVPIVDMARQIWRQNPTKALERSQG